MSAVLDGVRELLHLDRILQNLLCVLEIMHDLDAHCGGLRSTIGAHKDSASELGVQIKRTIQCEEGDRCKAVQPHKTPFWIINMPQQMRNEVLTPSEFVRNRWPSPTAAHLSVQSHGGGARRSANPTGLAEPDLLRADVLHGHSHRRRKARHCECLVR